MRAFFVVVHRWLGLATAVFLFIAGATGAVISWDHELDAWLNPHLYDARTFGPARPALDLAAKVEAADPRVRVTFLPLEAEPGHTLLMSVQPRIDARTRRPFDTGYNQVAVDPASGEIQGRREWGRVSLSREDLLPFLYKLHYSLHLPESSGIEWGVLFMGVIAIVWVIDTLVAVWISFPSLRTWRRSFAFRWRDGGHKLTFDLHRSGALWLYPLVLVVAITSVAMNLRNQVVAPVVSLFSELSPSPFASRSSAPADKPVEPLVSPSQAIAQASAEAHRRGWTKPAGGIFLSTSVGVWGVGFFEAGNSHGDGGLGNAWVYVDSVTGQPAGADVPGEGTAGDVFMQSMFPLHSGRIIGTAGRVLMTFLGIAMATLSVTGVLIWARKRRARTAAAAQKAFAQRAMAG
jgi:uncharacterized iron-regulated membrane protein